MRLEKLQYQQDAINAVLAAIDAANIRADDNACANPILANTRHIDVKMETGTGKTYVYTRLMHELRRQFGFFKFILLVPSIPIKEGVKMSVQSAEWNRHFRQEFGNQGIQLGVVNAGDFDAKKGRRKQVPESIRTFCEDSSATKNTIHALLLNDAMLASKSMTADDYDTTLFGGVTCPLEALRTVRPFVIIDEPHRFNKENKAWKNITEGLRPQLIFRFGATFPDREIGSGRARKVEKDYEKLVYELNAVRAFNEGLVKGVKIEYPEIPGGNLGRNEIVRYKVRHIARQEGVTFAQAGGRAAITLKIGEGLSALDPRFAGVVLENIQSAKSAVLSNDLELHPGMELLPQVFDASYQELLLNQALDEHFAIEKANFLRASNGVANLPRIKTNSLFFIDSVASFRGSGDEKKGWLREKFESLLKAKLEKEIKEASEDYKLFLEASLREIDKTMAGYFSEDNAKKGDARIQDEVDKVLRDKEQMIRLKNENGEWNTCRFLFSKWTLREGWDNPNVFVICKLRTSGSEISKIQEVGRGLRLPFDENGLRMSAQNSNEDFRLSYIIDFSEREFARRLIGEINNDGAKIDQGKINEEILKKLVEANYAEDQEMVFAKLIIGKIINHDRVILDSEKLFALLPEDSGAKLRKGVITGGGLPERPMLKLNRENFAKLRKLWDMVTRRYVLKFEKVPASELNAALEKTFSKGRLFVEPMADVITEILSKNEDGAIGLLTSREMPRKTDLGILPYGEFLKRLGKQTSLPVALLHKYIVRARLGQKRPEALFNMQTLKNIFDNFEKTFAELFAQKFSYVELDYHAQTSIFTAEGDFVRELRQGLVGEKIATGIPSDGKKYLYDKIAYDSDLERKVLEYRPLPERVVVYGKLPRRSIQLPTYTGGTTSPDFVYAIRGKNTDTVELHLIVEMKSENPRLSDEKAVDAQRKFFQGISPAIKWEMKTDADDLARLLEEMAEEK